MKTYLASLILFASAAAVWAFCPTEVAVAVGPALSIWGAVCSFMAASDDSDEE